VWRLEHAFERARAAGTAAGRRPYSHLRRRVGFSLCFLVLASAPPAGPWLERRPGNVDAQAAPGARGDLVDRNGAAGRRPGKHYGLYVDRAKSGTPRHPRRPDRALPDLPPSRIDKALAGDRRTYLAGGLTPDEKDGCSISACRA
jgi:cell division protein FtsI (penicillin-binding protein 3)